MFEGQLEDIPPADTAEIDLLRWAIGGAAQHKELWVKAHRKKMNSDSQKRIFSVNANQLMHPTN